MSHGRLAVAIVLCLSWATSPCAQPMSADEMLSYGVQSLCVDETGEPSSDLPIQAGCLRTRLQNSSDAAVYRKHDWPNVLNDRGSALGYQASDSVLQRRGGRNLAVQTFDFGGADQKFGRFDGRGDGGQVMLVAGDWASFAMTEDGGGGVQWFIGKGCRAAPDRDARFASWLVFRDDVKKGDWQSAVAQLNIAARPQACPRRFNDAYTRYRLDDVEFPFRVVSIAPTAAIARRRIDVVVSEHYGGSDIATAGHLERFFLGKGLGLLRWERWANGNVEQQNGVLESAQMLARTARCPPLQSYGAPEPHWWLVDCRTWTTLVRQVIGWSVDDFHWAALDGFGPRE